MVVALKHPIDLLVAKFTWQLGLTWGPAKVGANFFLLKILKARQE